MNERFRISESKEFSQSGTFYYNQKFLLPLSEHDRYKVIEDQFWYFFEKWEVETDAEKRERYRIMADNLVDLVIYLREKFGGSADWIALLKVKKKKLNKTMAERIKERRKKMKNYREKRTYRKKKEVSGETRWGVEGIEAWGKSTK